MKKFCGCIGLVLLMLLVLVPLSAGASGEGLPAIESQPQNPVYPVGSVAIYSVKATDTVDACTWFLEYGNETYDLSQLNGTEAWLAFVTGSCGSSQEGNTYHYFFEGIEEGLSGSCIYAVLQNGNKQVTSQKTIIQLSGTAMPPSIHVPTQAEISLGGELGLLCVATAPNGGFLTYTWYETSTGNLQDIIAIQGEDAQDPTLYVDTSEAGIRYYVCMVETEQGGVGYSSVIPVTVLEDSALVTEAPTQTPESSAIPTVKPTQSADDSVESTHSLLWLIPVIIVSMVIGAIISYVVMKKRIQK